MFSDPLALEIARFLREIGLAVRSGDIDQTTILPGIRVEQGVLVIDQKRLLYPGDILHEAGHLAVSPPDRRLAMHHDVGNDPAEEMMAIAWSYAAALYLGIDPAIVFHEDGYRGGGSYLLENFESGRYLALPMLQWVGMTDAGENAVAAGYFPYPKMRRWLRA